MIKPSGESLGGTDLISCENSTGIDTSYCCDHQNGPCCDNGVGRFNVLPPHPSTSATYNHQASRYDVLPPSSKSSPTPSASLSTTSGPKTTDLDGQSPTNQNGPTTTAGDAAQPTKKPSEGLSLSATAGIGVGVGLGVSALAVASYLLWRRYRKNKASRDSTQGAPYGQYGVASGMPQHQATAEYYKQQPQSQFQPQPQWQTSPPQELAIDTYFHELGPSQGLRREY